MVNQEKRWDWKHMLSYEMRIGQWEIALNNWIEKKDWIKNDTQKGKDWIENIKNGLPNH